MPKPFRKKLAKWMIIGAAVLVIGWFALGYIVGRVIESKLAAQLAKHVEGATFESGAVKYSALYGVTIHNVHITLPGQDGRSHDALSLDRLHLRLAALPIGRGPLLIERIEIDDPVVRFFPRAAPTRPRATTKPASDRKLSEIFRLRKLILRKGRIEYQGRDASSPPMVWQNIDVNTDITPQDAARYGFAIAAKNASLADLNIKGTFDIDQLLLIVDKLSMRVSVKPDAPAAELPAVLQRICRDYKISGAIAIDANANIPLRDANAATGQLDLALGGGTLMDETATAKGSLRAAGAGLIVAENFSVQLGNDDLQITSARMPQAQLGKSTRIEEIVAKLTLREPAEHWPTRTGEIIRKLEPAGVVNLAGYVARDPDTRKFDYNILVATDDAAVVVTDKRIPITRIRTDATISTGDLTITSMRGQSLGGLVEILGRLKFDEAKNFSARGSVHELDLTELASALQLSEKQKESLAGRGSIDFKFDGQAKKFLETLTGNGEFDIERGRLWEIPVMREITGNVPGVRDAVTVGEAAGVFKIENKTVRLTKAAVSAPVIGVQGSGDIHFDGAIDLTVTVAPLADWKKQIKQTNVPVISDVIGEVAGTVQRGFNAAQRTLYEYRVGGTISKPQTQLVPTPILTKPGEEIFKKMIEPSGEKLIDTIRGK